MPGDMSGEKMGQREETNVEMQGDGKRWDSRTKDGTHRAAGTGRTCTAQWLCELSNVRDEGVSEPCFVMESSWAVVDGEVFPIATAVE
jgi:hypothetical protein